MLAICVVFSAFFSSSETAITGVDKIKLKTLVDQGNSRALLLNILLKDPKVLKTPAPTVAVGELGDSSVNILVRPHATVDNYWDVYFSSLQNVKVALDGAGIEIPFPQQVNHTAK